MEVTTAYDPRMHSYAHSGATPGFWPPELGSTGHDSLESRADQARAAAQALGFSPLDEIDAQIGCDPVDVIASLPGTKFSVASSLDARVIERSSDDKLHLSPVFGDASAGFSDPSRRGSFAGRRNQRAGGSCRAQPRIGFDSLGCAEEFAGRQQPLLLAFTDAEVLLFHRLGCEFQRRPISSNSVVIKPVVSLPLAPGIARSVVIR